MGGGGVRPWDGGGGGVMEGWLDDDHRLTRMSWRRLLVVVGGWVSSWIYAYLSTSSGPILGPATHCDAAHLRWDVLKPLRCRKAACDALRCKFQHVGNFAPDVGISQLFII